MGLEQLSKEVAAYIEDSKQGAMKYIELDSELNEQISKGLKTPLESANKRNEYKNSLDNSLKENKAKLIEKLKETKEKEYSKLSNSYDPVTADLVAEINLLSQMDLDSNDIKQYKEKYKNTPLLMKKLRSISQSKGIFVYFEETKEEHLENAFNFLENTVQSFSQPEYSSYGAKLNMIANGAVEKINKNLEMYQNY